MADPILIPFVVGMFVAWGIQHAFDYVLTTIELRTWYWRGRLHEADERLSRLTDEGAWLQTQIDEIES